MTKTLVKTSVYHADTQVSIMSRLAEYRALEQKLASQLAELEALKNDGALQKEMEFEEKLRALLAEYGYSLKNVVALLDPQSITRQATASFSAAKAARKPRELKRYKNPHSGEVVETKGGNHTVLKGWKAEFGAQEVESWLQ